MAALLKLRKQLTPEEILWATWKNYSGKTPSYESLLKSYTLYKLFRLNTPLHPGDNIRLEATAENGKYHASAEVTVPQPIESLHVDTCLAYLREYSGTNPLPPIQNYIARPPQREELLPAGHLE